jgi:hypothetical protein
VALRRLVLTLLPAIAGAGIVAAIALGGFAAGGPQLKLVGSAPKGGTINSDLAFWGKLAFAGNYDGLRVIDLSNPAKPTVLADLKCRGPQGDTSVWQNLVFVSVDRPQTTPGCDSADAPENEVDGTFEGVRVFDVSDPRNPRFVKMVETDCGSHTHTLIPDVANGRVILYVSSYSLIAGPHCGPGREANPLHGKISVVEVPLAAPDQARVLSTPEIRAPQFGGGRFLPTVACHDVSVFLPAKIAAAACMSEGQLWDISDPANPKTLEARHITNSAFEFWHSATFSRDGKVVVFGDESLSSSCHSTSERDGRLWFYSVAKPAKALSSFAIKPRVLDYCSVHMFNTLPVAKRNLLVAGWYMAGTQVIDFADPKKPKLLASLTPKRANTWATYFYDGYAYANDIERGVDVFSLSPGLTKGTRRLGHLNPGTQELALP